MLYFVLRELLTFIYNFNIFAFYEIEVTMEQDDNTPRHFKNLQSNKPDRSLDNLFCRARKLEVHTQIDKCSDFSIHLKKLQQHPLQGQSGFDLSLS